MKVKIILLIFLMVIATISTSILGTLSVAAQNVANGERPDQPRGSNGLADPPHFGMQVLYMFTGVVNDTTPNNAVATAVMCANIGFSPIQTRVEFYSRDAYSAHTRYVIIPGGRAATFSTQETAVFSEELLVNTWDFHQGSGRVTADLDSLICTVQVLDPVNDPPVFMARLALYDGYGSPYGTKHNAYLPALVQDN